MATLLIVIGCVVAAVLGPWIAISDRGPRLTKTRAQLKGDDAGPSAGRVDGAR